VEDLEQGADVEEDHGSDRDASQAVQLRDTIRDRPTRHIRFRERCLIEWLGLVPGAGSRA